MEHDYFKLIKDISRAMEGIIEVFKELCDRLKPHAKQILKFLESLEEYKPINRIKHKPVRQIKPNKIVSLNKRPDRFYCRNNC